MKEAKYKFWATPILLLYIQRNTTSREVTYFSKICYRTQFQDATISGASVVPMSDVRTVSVLILLVV
jgi:hypothetical protein